MIKARMDGSSRVPPLQDLAKTVSSASQSVLHPAHHDTSIGHFMLNWDPPVTRLGRVSSRV